MTEDRFFPIHDVRPSDDYIERWRAHIEKTSHPETFEGVSTVRPRDLEGLVLLSGELKIQSHVREDQEMAPCPLCSPHSPKFMNGLMAWFPLEKTVQFIGHSCAKRHLGEEFTVAERRFRSEWRARRVVDRWGALCESAPVALSWARQLLPICKAVDRARNMLTIEADGFSQMLQDEFRREGGRIFEEGPAFRGTDRKLTAVRKQVGTVIGLELLANGPQAQKLQRAIAVLESHSEPLPELLLGDDETVARIVARGVSMRGALGDVQAVRNHVADARQFFHPNNLALLELWGELPSSPCTLMKIRRKGQYIFLDCESYHGKFTARFDLDREFDADLPDVRISILDSPIAAMEPAE
jgi:hypothetical protein